MPGGCRAPTCLREIKDSVMRQDGADKRLKMGLARRLARRVPSFFAKRLEAPVFIVGFNNCGKSTVVRLLESYTRLSIYPGEGNGELWFPGYFPWIESDVAVGPIWTNQLAFLEASQVTRQDGFLRARAQLGAYQWLNGGRRVLNDSGMLAGLAPDILERFPDATFVHFIRDGRLSSYLTARIEWTRIMRSPGKYIEHGCPLDFKSVLACMARYWAWTIGRMNQVAAAMPGRVLELRYEEVWGRPEDAVRRIAEFLDVPVQGKVPDLRYKDLSELLLSEITEEEQALLEQIVGPTMLAKGYQLGGVSIASSEGDH